MKLRECELPTPQTRTKVKGRWEDIFNEFLRSDMQCAVIEGVDAKDRNTYNSARMYVICHSLKERVRVMRRGGELILQRIGDSAVQSSDSAELGTEGSARAGRSPKGCDCYEKIGDA